jgi:hypothetical protein
MLAPLATSGAVVSVSGNPDCSIRENPSHEIEAGRKRRPGVLAGARGESEGLGSKKAGRKGPERLHPRDGRVRRQPWG